jgi:uncharacterized protein involved in exopolysaccharide biosynthesis
MNDKQYYDDEIDLIELFRTLLKYYKIIVATTIMFTLFAVVYALLSPSIYKSEIKFFVPKQDKGSMSGYMSAINSLGFGGLVGGDSSSDTIVNLINSRRMAKDIVLHFNLVEHYLKDSDNQIENEEKDLHDTINAVRNSLSINQDKTGLITLGVENQEPELAAKIANFTVLNLDIINEDLQISSQKPLVTILDPAEVPFNRFRPKRKMIVIIGFLTGGILAVFLSFTIDYLKKVF